MFIDSNVKKWYHNIKMMMVKILWKDHYKINSIRGYSIKKHLKPEGQDIWFLHIGSFQLIKLWINTCTRSIEEPETHTAKSSNYLTLFTKRKRKVNKTLSMFYGSTSVATSACSVTGYRFLWFYIREYVSLTEMSKQIDVLEEIRSLTRWIL